MLLVFQINHIPKSHVYAHIYNYTNFYGSKINANITARIANVSNDSKNISGPIFFLSKK